MATTFASYAELIEAWPSPTDLARDLGEPDSKNVWKWRTRGVLPTYHWRRLVAAARRRRIRGVTLEALARLEEAKRPEFPAA